MEAQKGIFKSGRNKKRKPVAGSGEEHADDSKKGKWRYDDDPTDATVGDDRRSSRKVDKRHANEPREIRWGKRDPELDYKETEQDRINDEFAKENKHQTEAKVNTLKPKDQRKKDFKKEADTRGVVSNAVFFVFDGPDASKKCKKANVSDGAVLRTFVSSKYLQGVRFVDDPKVKVRTVTVPFGLQLGILNDIWKKEYPRVQLVKQGFIPHLKPIDYMSFASSMCHLHYEGVEEVGIGFKIGEYWVFPSHYLDHIPRYIEAFKDAPSLDKLYVQRVKLDDFEALANYDVCRIKDKLGAPAIRTWGYADGFASDAAVLSTARLLSPSIVYQNDELGVPQRKHLAMSVTTVNNVVWKPQEGKWLMNAHTVPGSCGSLFVVQNSNGVATVLGYHIEGAISGTESKSVGFSGPILEFLNLRGPASTSVAGPKHME